MAVRQRHPMMALPFCQIELRVQNPAKTALYPKSLNTLGDHIRKRRLDLALYQKDIAQILGASTNSIMAWESGRKKPKKEYVPKIYEFLRYCPFDLGSHRL